MNRLSDNVLEWVTVGLAALTCMAVTELVQRAFTRRGDLARAESLLSASLDVMEGMQAETTPDTEEQADGD